MSCLIWLPEGAQATSSGTLSLSEDQAQPASPHQITEGLEQWNRMKKCYKVMYREGFFTSLGLLQCFLSLYMWKKKHFPFSIHHRNLSQQQAGSGCVSPASRRHGRGWKPGQAWQHPRDESWAATWREAQEISWLALLNKSITFCSEGKRGK